MRQMDFLNGVHSVGVNVTVRRGYKWTDLKIGETLELTDKGKPTGIEITVLEFQVKRFFAICDDDLFFEHDPECKTRVGLLKAMKSAYPDFIPEDVCVIVKYYKT